jgi:hypothetical protein
MSTFDLDRMEPRRSHVHSAHFHIGSAGEPKAFITLASFVWTYIILRALMVPWIHDESTSLYWFVERETFLPYVALWDAGNHFLSSAIGVLGHKLWGLSLFGSRIGSVLAFPLYAWAVYRIGSFMNDRLVRWCLWSALLACPFLLDFFSLFRGYGLGMAFFLVAVDGAIRYRSERQTRHLVQLLLGFALADFAVLSLVPLWALVVALLAVDLGMNWRTTRSIEVRKLLLWITLGVLPLLFGVLLSWEMRRRGLLYHGSLEGFVPVTLASLSKFVLGSLHPLVLLGAGTSVVAATAALFLRSTWRGPLLVVAALLWADVCMRVGMALILDVNYPEDRAALHMVPLAILLIAFAVDAIAEQKHLFRFATLLLLVLPVRSIVTANLDHTALWPEQSVPLRFLERIATEHGTEQLITIGSYHQIFLVIPYGARLNGLSLNPPDVQGFPHTPTDYRIVDDRFLNEALPGYRTVDHAPGPGLYLLQREKPLKLEELERHGFNFPIDTKEFMELWRNDTSTVAQDLFFEVQAVLDSETPFHDLRLVMEQKKSDESLNYHTIRLAALSPSWKNGRLHVLLRMPSVPEANSRVLYFWNPDLSRCSVSEGTVRILSEASQLE